MVGEVLPEQIRETVNSCLEDRYRTQVSNPVVVMATVSIEQTQTLATALLSLYV